MRSIVLAAIMAAGIGLAGASVATAAPASGTAIDQSAKQGSTVTQVHWRGRSRHWRHRCHYRRYSRWGWC